MSKRWALLAALLLSLAVPAVARAEPGSDNFTTTGNALPLGGFESQLTFGYSIQADEIYTDNDPVPKSCDGVRMASTAWWTIPSTVTGRVTVTTEHSGYDTVLAVYRFDPGSFAFIAPYPCNNNMNPASRTSRLRVTIDPRYMQVIHVGGCTGSITICSSGTDGGLAVSLLRTPANDDRAQAMPLTNGRTSAAVATAGATTLPGERLTCGTAPYDKTVWYSFRAPSTGSLTLTAAGANAVMSVYEGSATAPKHCFDDPRAGVEQTSTSVATKAATIYYVQVGGAGASEADDGNLTMRASFTDPDLDDDRELNGADCAPTDGRRSHLKVEIVNNDVDEDCDGRPAYNRDGDRYIAKPVGTDCDDTRKRVHPGAHDVRGNKLNEDCVDGAAPFLAPASVVHWKWAPAFSSIRLTKLYVEPVPKKTRIKVRCSGGGCPLKTWSRTIRKRKGKVNLDRLFPRPLPPGVTIDVQVTKPETRGTGRRFRTTAGDLSATLLCNSPKKKRWKHC
jgi:hypothetical protein